MGAGTGYLMALLKLVNLSPYGVEVNPIVANIANKKLETFFKEETPLVSVGNYFDPNFPNLQFRDGTKVSDFDAFICRSYNETHALDILFNVMSRNEIKIGSLLQFEVGPRIIDNNDELQSVSKMIYHDCGWEPQRYRFFQKVKDSSVSPESLKRFNELLFSCRDLWGDSYKRDDTFDLAAYAECAREKQPEQKPKTLQERLEDRRNAPAF